MNAKALIPLLAGLGIGGLALVLGINTLKNARAGQRMTAKVKIWAAKEDVPRGAALREEMLAEVAWAADMVPPGAFKKKEDLVGRVPRLVAPAGLPILESMLSPPGTTPGIFVKPGYRAVAVKIDAGSGVDYHLEPGSFVDVVGSFKVKRDGRTETIARTIIENAEVAAVGPRVSPATGADGDKREKERGQAIRAVTLFVKPEQVPKLLLTEQEGRIKLSMRGLLDDSSLANAPWATDSELTGEVPVAAADETDPADAEQTSPLDWVRGLFGGRPAAPQPTLALAAAAPPPPPPVEHWVLRIFKAGKEEVVQFKSADSWERVDASSSPPVMKLPPLTAEPDNEAHNHEPEPEERSE